MKNNPVSNVCSAVVALLFGFGAAAHGTTTIAPRIGLNDAENRIEAEAFDNSSAGTVEVKTYQTSARGRSTLVVNARPGQWLGYTLNVQEAGVYLAEVAITSPGQGGTFHIEIDGIDQTGPLLVPDTGSELFGTLVAKHGVQLNPGIRFMRVAFDIAGPAGMVGNFDYIHLVPGVSSVPGQVLARRFNHGGDGVAYHDTDGGNNGGHYRVTDVDIDYIPSMRIAPGLMYVGWTQAGEWLEYTVDVGADGFYTMRAVVASEGQGGTFHVEFNGEDKTGPLTMPNTGNWRGFAEIHRESLYLTAGVQTLRIAFDSIGPSGSVGNFARLQFWLEDVQSFCRSPCGVHIIQAENFDYGGEGAAYHDSDHGNNGTADRGTDVDLDFDPNTGSYVGWTAAGEWLKYTTAVHDSGRYTLQVNVASEGEGGTFHIEFDGVDKTGPIQVADTGGWRRWTIITKTGVQLDAGTHEMRIIFDSVGPSGSIANIDWLRFLPEVNGRSTFDLYPASRLVKAVLFDNGGEGVSYHDTDQSNNGRYFRSTGVDIDFDPNPDPWGHPTLYVGWTQAGEWLAYTFDVIEDRDYSLEVRLASDGAGGLFHIEVDGQDVTGPITVPDTGGWRNWEQRLVKTGIHLTAGTRDMRIVFDSIGPSGSVGNIHYVYFR